MTNYYIDKTTRRLPPIATSRGKQARIILTPLLLFGFMALIFNIADENSTNGKIVGIGEVTLGVLISIILALAQIGKLGRK